MYPKDKFVTFRYVVAELLAPIRLKLWQKYLHADQTVYHDQLWLPTLYWNYFHTQGIRLKANLSLSSFGLYIAKFYFQVQPGIYSAFPAYPDIANIGDFYCCKEL